MSIIILPNQLFEENNLIDENIKNIYLLEHPLYFSKYSYHKMKLLYHRATMKYYFDFLNKKYKNKKIKYLEYTDNYKNIFKKEINIVMYNPIDHDIYHEFSKLKVKFFDNPNFICSQEILNEYLKQTKSTTKFVHSYFYIWCRKKFDILLNTKQEPLGGKWSFDDENRLPFPKGYNQDMKIKEIKNKYINEAKKYVEDNFDKNFGDNWCYMPITHTEAKKHFKKFLKQRLECFGPYEDAVDEKIIFGCHSVLSPMINIGLLNPDYIIKETQKYYKKHKSSIASTEGFIRQIFWREYVMFMYMHNYDNLTKPNYFKHKKDINKNWYDGTTQVMVIDNLINKLKKYGYLHHIERLMYMGNFFLLNKIDPEQVYEWFMLFIDAYPWVMVPNVYGMSQHSSGPIMMKKPYFSSSNYIIKMSTYKKTQNTYQKITINNQEYEWFEIWDALYYNFINDNIKLFSKIYSTAQLVKHWKNKTKKEKDDIIDIAHKYLKKY
jgi:deoxyribodipyrimidine photolyase-related protein